MNVLIYSREKAEELIKSGLFPKNAAVISFCDCGVEPRDRVNYSAVCDRVMYIELDDIAHEDFEEYGLSDEAFFPEAEETAEFILSAAKDGANIVSQCEYGEGRSAGCAAAILEHFEGAGITVFADDRYYPNKAVFRKLLDSMKKYAGKSDYFEIDECVRLLKYNGSDESVVIPNGVNVICGGAFAKSRIRSVKIPDSVREIGAEAFRGSYIEELILPESVGRVGESAFRDCEFLEIITIKNPDMKLSKRCFDRCTNVKRILCCERSVWVTETQLKSPAGFTDTVMNIMAFVCHGKR